MANLVAFFVALLRHAGSVKQPARQTRHRRAGDAEHTPHKRQAERRLDYSIVNLLKVIRSPGRNRPIFGQRRRSQHLQGIAQNSQLFIHRIWVGCGGPCTKNVRGGITNPAPLRYWQPALGNQSDNGPSSCIRASSPM
jgi:hypothetical protein